MRIDNGGEFTYHGFNDFYQEVEIKRYLNVPYNPQKNGVVERKNRSICEVAKAMMTKLDIPYLLWEKVAIKFLYVKNRSSHATLGDKTPKEAFIVEKLEVGHFRIFGCPIYIHVSKEKRTKMEPSRKKGTFFVCSETAKAYHIYVLGKRYIEVSRDVMFDDKKDS